SRPRGSRLAGGGPGSAPGRRTEQTPKEAVATMAWPAPGHGRRVTPLSVCRGPAFDYPTSILPYGGYTATKDQKCLVRQNSGVQGKYNQLEELTGSTRESSFQAAAPGGVRVHGRMATAVQMRTRCASIELIVPHRAGGIHRRPVGVADRSALRSFPAGLRPLPPVLPQLGSNHSSGQRWPADRCGWQVGPCLAGSSHSAA